MTTTGVRWSRTARVSNTGQTAPSGSPTMQGTLTQVTGLRVVVDGATVDSPCFWIGPTSTVAINDRVQVTVRSYPGGRTPLVQLLQADT